MSVGETIRAQIRAALSECCPSSLAATLTQCGLVDRVVQLAREDAQAFATKDPACPHDPDLIVRTCASFRAVLHYRLAHAMDGGRSVDCFPEARAHAPGVSSRGKVLSGAELHHQSRIGRRFILDRGVGTVVGDTSEIGDDCHIQGCVILGADDRFHSSPGKRHPTLGDRVRIGAFSRVLGPVRIGHDVQIGPSCTITSDIEPYSHLFVQIGPQVVRRHEAHPEAREPELHR